MSSATTGAAIASVCPSLVLADVEHGEHRLVGQQEELLELSPGVCVEVCAVQRHTRTQAVDTALEQLHDPSEGAVALEHPGVAVERLLCTGQIGERQFDLDDSQMLEGVCGAGHVAVGKGPQHEDDGIDLADVRQEGIAESLPVTGTLDQTADVGELDGCRHDPAAAAHLGESVEAGIGHLGDADVGIGRRERIRGSVSAPAGECVVQRALPRVGQPNKSESLHSTTLSATLSGTVKAMTNVTSPARQETTADAGSAERAFSRSVLISGVRCSLTYVLIPFIFPLVGFGAGVGPVIGIPVGLAAIVANIVSIRRFHRADHRWKRPMITINALIIVLLVILVAVDFAQL